MSKIMEVEPLVLDALLTNPKARDDNFVLYNEVLSHYINIRSMPIGEVFEKHKELGIPSLETITRCRRKIQERDHSLASSLRAKEAREEEEAEHRDYALADKACY